METALSAPAASRPAGDVARAGAAWLLSVLPLAAPAWAEGPLAGLSRSGLCLLPWLALLGLPRSAARVEAPTGARRSGGAAAELALLLPVLGLAARVDRDLGVPPVALAGTVAGGLVAAALLALAGRAAAGGAAYALGWMALVVGGPLLAASLGPAAGGPAPGIVRFVARASPLRWAWARLEPAPRSLSSADLLPLAALVALLALSRLGRSAGEERR